MTESKPRTVEELIEPWRRELRGYLSEMGSFVSKDTLEILQLLSSYSARASWMRNQAVRSGSRAVDAFRTKEIDPFLGEVDRQFKIWSRIAAIMANEYEISRGR